VDEQMENMEGRTLKEWRELRGLSRDELAERVGVDAETIARLEEVGDPTYADTIEGDAYLNGVIGPIMEALGLDGGVALTELPSAARPGCFVLDPAALWELDESVARFIIEHAEEIDLRLAVPNKWDVGLKPHEYVTEADVRAIKEYCDKEVAYVKAMAEYHGNMAALLSEHATDENQKTGDVLEIRGDRWVPKKRKGEGEG
jgi:transcriptional regulator with XRE-family HTH domain